MSHKTLIVCRHYSERRLIINQSNQIGSFKPANFEGTNLENAQLSALEHNGNSTQDEAITRPDGNHLQ